MNKSVLAGAILAAGLIASPAMATNAGSMSGASDLFDSSKACFIIDGSVRKSEPGREAVYRYDGPSWSWGFFNSMTEQLCKEQSDFEGKGRIAIWDFPANVKRTVAGNGEAPFIAPPAAGSVDRVTGSHFR